MVNGSLLGGSSELRSVFTRVDGTHMSDGFTASLVRQDTSSDEDSNGQSLRPHTGLDNLPNPISLSRSSQYSRFCLPFVKVSGAYPS